MNAICLSLGRKGGRTNGTAYSVVGAENYLGLAGRAETKRTLTISCFACKESFDCKTFQSVRASRHSPSNCELENHRRHEHMIDRLLLESLETKSSSVVCRNDSFPFPFSDVSVHRASSNHSLGSLTNRWTKS